MVQRFRELAKLNELKVSSAIETAMGWNNEQHLIFFGFSDSQSAKCSCMHRSVDIGARSLNDKPTIAKSKVQDCVTWSVLESELPCLS